MAMVTPFDAEGRLDLDGAAHDWLAGWSTRATTVWSCAAGTTGESPTLTGPRETRLVAGRRRGGDRVPVIAGSGTNDTRHSIELTRLGDHLPGGRRPYCSLRPYYNPSTPVAEPASMPTSVLPRPPRDLPVMLYDIPMRTGTQDRPRRPCCGSGGEVPNIVGVKDAAADPAGAVGAADEPRWTPGAAWRSIPAPTSATWPLPWPWAPWGSVSVASPLGR